MGLVQAIKQARKGNFIGDIKIDNFVVESMTSSVIATRNPVESGPDFNDHIRIEPLTFSINAIVSNTPTNIISSVAGLTSDKVKDTWQDLIKLQKSKEAIDLVLGGSVYQNVALVSLSKDIDKTTANALFFTADFQELIVVGETQILESNYDASNTSDRAVPQTNGGLRQMGSIA